MGKQKKQQKRKIGRNDLCWCGSGKKFKECHVPLHDEQRALQRNLEEAQDSLMTLIMDAVQEVPMAFPHAMELFWNGKYGVQHLDELDDIENSGASRFLVWFAFNYVLEHGATVVEHMAQKAHNGELVLNDHEAALLPLWVSVRMNPYSIKDIVKGKGFTLCNIFDQSCYYVKDKAASQKVALADVIVGHLVPVGKTHAGTPPIWAQHGEPPPSNNPDTLIATAESHCTPLFMIAGTVAHLSADTSDKLVEFTNLHLADLQRTQPDASWEDLLRQRSHVLNHFVMDLPFEENNLSIMDEIVLKTRVALQLTGSAFSGLVGKNDAHDTSDTDTIHDKSNTE